MQVARRGSMVVLGLGPFLTIGLVAARDLREAGLHQAVGVAWFAGLAIATGLLGGRGLLADDSRRGLATAGLLLQVPFGLVALLWVGMGTPWQSTPAENLMRYAVLLGGAIAVAVALVFLTDGIREAGERFYSTLGFATNLLAGAAYLIWTSFQLGVHVIGPRSSEVQAMNDVNDILLFVACALTYATTAAFAAALGRIRWLGRRASAACVGLCLVALGFLALRGLAFPSGALASSAWYTEPGVIVGIPAVPWLLPALLGVVLLRRAGDAP